MSKRANALPSSHPSLPRVTEEVRVISDFLLAELLSWPNVSTRPMFGLTALYRGREIFAALPRTRAMETACSVSFKIQRHTPAIVKALDEDSRIVCSEGKMAHWLSFEVESDRDIPDAIQWFARAYEQAAKRNPSSPKRAKLRH